MAKAKLLVSIVIVSMLTILVGACALPAMPVSGPGGTLNVYVTDAPARDEVTSIMVTVSEVQVHKASAEQEREQEKEQSGTANQTPAQGGEKEQQTQQDGGEWIKINFGQNAATFDLLAVKGIEQFLGTNEVAAGKYTQVRLVVDNVKVALGGGELKDATLPSKELKIVHPFDIIAGESTALVIDFDAEKMVTVTGADKIMVKPVVKLTVRQEKGGAKPEKETSKGGTTKQPSVEVSCNEFASNKQISKEIEVNAGDSFEVALCSNASTGFKWSEAASIVDPAVLQQSEHKIAAPKGGTPPPGAPGQETWTFKALKQGKTTISMEYSQPWDGGMKKEWTFGLTVVVK